MSSTSSSSVSLSLWGELFTRKSPQCMWVEVEQQRAPPMDDTQKRFAEKTQLNSTQLNPVSAPAFPLIYLYLGLDTPPAAAAAVVVVPFYLSVDLLPCCAASEPFSVHFSRVIGHVSNCSALLCSTRPSTFAQLWPTLLSASCRSEGFLRRRRRGGVGNWDNQAGEFSFFFVFLVFLWCLYTKKNDRMEFPIEEAKTALLISETN